MKVMLCEFFRKKTTNSILTVFSFLQLVFVLSYLIPLVADDLLLISFLVVTGTVNVFFFMLLWKARVDHVAPQVIPLLLKASLILFGASFLSFFVPVPLLLLAIVGLFEVYLCFSVMDVVLQQSCKSLPCKLKGFMGNH